LPGRGQILTALIADDRQPGPEGGHGPGGTYPQHSSVRTGFEHVQNSAYPVGGVDGGPAYKSVVPAADQDGAVRVGQQCWLEEPGHVSAAGPGGLPSRQLAGVGDGIPAQVLPGPWLARRRKEGDPLGAEEPRQPLRSQVEPGRSCP